MTSFDDTETIAGDASDTTSNRANAVDARSGEQETVRVPGQPCALIAADLDRLFTQRTEPSRDVAEYVALASIATLRLFNLSSLMVRCQFAGNPTRHESVGSVEALTVSAEPGGFSAAAEAIRTACERGKGNSDSAENLHTLPGLRLIIDTGPDLATWIAGATADLSPNDHACLYWNSFSKELSWIALDANSTDKTQHPVSRYTHELIRQWEASGRQPDPFTVPMVPQGEVERQIQWGQPHSRFQIDKPAYRYVEEHAETQGDRPAIRCVDAAYTFAQLNNLANGIAHQLIDKGLTPGDFVGVLLEPSVGVIASLIAIHKAGGIYVPLDPGFPGARLASMAGQVSMRFTLVDAQTRPIASEIDTALLEVDGIISLAETHTFENPEFCSTIDIPSHVFFTSGTTGVPKGILAKHQNFTQSVFAAVHRYGYTGDDRFVAIARNTFSISMYEFMAALVLGGSVRLMTKPEIMALDPLIDALQSSTVLHCVPTLLRALIDRMAASDRGSATAQIRVLLTGGDMVPPEVLEAAKAAFPIAEIYVNYGSSEISCMGCTFPVKREQPVGRTKVGKPHPNMEVRILDAHRNPVPSGTSGELYFSGEGLVIGYIGNEKANREKFHQIDGKRFFAIGDIGRFDAQGNIELLGRNDFQVQIDGIRIELTEIESTVKALPGVKDCVVVGDCKEGQNHSQLIAYLVFSGETLDPSEIQSALQKTLPDYMVPSVLVGLDRMPLNHNGKVDRKNLPQPSEENRLRRTAASVGPETETEALLHTLWCELFQLSDISVLDDFFDLGGNSLKAVRSMAAASEILGRTLPITLLLNNRNIRALARAIDALEDSDESEVTIIKDGSVGAPTLFCCNGVLQYRDLAAKMPAHRAVAGVTLPEESAIITGDSNDPAHSTITSMAHIVKRYTAAIREAQPFGPYYLCGASFGGIIAIEVARTLMQEGEAVPFVALFDTWAPGYRSNLSLPRRILRKALALTGKQAARQQNIDVANPDLIDDMAPAAVPDPRASVREKALAAYHCSYFEGKIILFNARDRKREIFERNDRHLGWASICQELAIHSIPGTHTGILLDGNVEEIVEVLSREML